jgi:hypothetical protein
MLLDSGATPDSQLFWKPDEEWLEQVGKELGQGAVDRYRLFWEKKRRQTAVERRWWLWMREMMGSGGAFMGLGIQYLGIAFFGILVLLVGLWLQTLG